MPELTVAATSIQYAPPIDAGIAQLVEHNLAKVGVASSNLVSRSKLLKGLVLMPGLLFAQALR